MTTCSSDSASSYDLEEHFDLSDSNEQPVSYIQEESDELIDSLSSQLKTVDSRCDRECLGPHVNCSSDNSEMTVMEPEAGCNGLLAQVDPNGHTCCSPAEVSNGKVHDGVTACVENGPVSEIPAISTINCEASSEELRPSFTGTSDDSEVSLSSGTEISTRASHTQCTNRTVTSELKPCLTNSIPLLTIPQTDHGCADDKSFTVLPSFPAEDTTAMIQVKPPSVFSVPCTGKESNNDVFTDVSLNDDDVPVSYTHLTLPTKRIV